MVRKVHIFFEPTFASMLLSLKMTEIHKSLSLLTLTVLQVGLI